MTRAELLRRHDELAAELAGVYDALGVLLPDERRIKVEVFFQAQGSDKVRTNAADQASLHVSTEVLSQQRKVDALTTELENVRLQLHYS